MSLTTPLGLMRHLRKPDQRMEIIPWLNVGLLAAGIALLGSSFVYAPGIAIALGPAHTSTVNMPATLTLSKISGGPLTSRAPDAVLTVSSSQRDPDIIIAGGIHKLAGLKEPLQNSFRNLPKNSPGVLLIKAPGDLHTEILLQICRMAGQAGFVEVQVAAQESDTLPTAATAGPRADAPATTATP